MINIVKEFIIKRMKYLMIAILVVFVMLSMNSISVFAKEMRSLVVYYSSTGNTRRVALALAEKTKSDIFEIKI